MGIEFWLLAISTLLIISLLIYLLRKKDNQDNQLRFVFIYNLLFTLIISFGVLFQTLCVKYFKIDPIIWENIIYIGTCFLPVSIFFTGLIFVNTKIKFRESYFLLFIIPTLSLIVLWTNPYHHLFYQRYSFNINECIYGNYMIIHHIYSFVVLTIGLFTLLKFSIKNLGFFSKQSILISIGILIPIITNILGSFQIIPMTVFITPITFAISILCFAFAIFKFDLLKITPIALQKVVDKISDAYIIINENNIITDFNQSLLDTFKLSDLAIRNMDIINLLKKKYNRTKYDLEPFLNAIKETRKDNSTVIFEKYLKSMDKYFHIEINSITNKDNFLGTLILIKDITQHTKDMQIIKGNQDMIVEQARLASLGQMIGGIAHNLKTPIMSIAGAAEGLSDLIKEYDESIEDPEVTPTDHHEIANDMYEWIQKIRTHLEYMSDVITAVKGQAVTFSSNTDTTFTIDELVKYINILMKHELENALINLSIKIDIDKNTEIKGNINSLVQVINNIISNSIQAYNGKTNENIVFEIYKKNNTLILKIQDSAGGLPEKVQKKIFKEMITTKGKNGTGLGLFMSYSNIKAHFNGNLRFETKKGIGTSFYIEIPLTP